MFVNRTVIAALLACAVAGTAAAARPLIIEESSTIQSPNPAIYSSFGFENVQATDGSLARGSGGLVTFKAAANFDNYDAYQP